MTGILVAALLHMRDLRAERDADPEAYDRRASEAARRLATWVAGKPKTT